VFRFCSSPRGADQYSNAERIVTAGAGLQLLRDDLSVDAVRESVHALLENARYRRSAEGIQTEIHEMPDARDAVTRIEALTSG
jgi:UDP:flavonoid glycosyltransferase YjiC (YdhE family)